MADLLLKAPDTSLEIAPGLLAWSAVCVTWVIRRAMRKHIHVSTELVQTPNGVAARPSVGFGTRSTGLGAIPPTPPPTGAQLKAKRHLDKKLWSLVKLNTHLDELSARGYVLVFSNGSSEHFDSVGWVGGYGIFVDVGVEVFDFMPLHMKRTVNLAELLAAVTAMKLHAGHDKVALFADSAYVLLGAKGAARQWKLNGWKGSSRPVSNVKLWQELLDYLDNTFQRMKWVKVPSHVNVRRNEEANTVANQGSVNNPMYPVKKTPHGRRLHPTCTTARAGKNPKALPPEISPIKPMFLKFDVQPNPPPPNSPAPRHVVSQEERLQHGGGGCLLISSVRLPTVSVHYLLGLPLAYALRVSTKYLHFKLMPLSEK